MRLPAIADRSVAHRGTLTIIGRDVSHRLDGDVRDALEAYVAGAPDAAATDAVSAAVA